MVLDALKMVLRPNAIVCVLAGVAGAANVTIELNMNNVKGMVGQPGVQLLGVFGNLSACETACLSAIGSTCLSFTWHHLSFPKPEYQGHCYGHTDTYWDPVAQPLIDSGVCNGRVPGVCASGADCSGFNGDCVSGACQCHPGWAGIHCGSVKWVKGSARKAYESDQWTWGGSPIRDEKGLYHLFSSQMTNDCGILHYCSNSQVIHLVSKDPLGPYALRAVALKPRPPPFWDSGAVHGVSVHALPQSAAAAARNSGRLLPKYALYYMGTKNDWQYPHGAHPNCSAVYDPRTGDRGTRRIGVATSYSLDGPWERRDAPVLDNGNASAGDWDFGDQSNPTPVIADDGSVVMLYKGRGSVQSVGSVGGPRFDGPFVRSHTRGVTGGEDPWGWIDPKSGVYHSFTHDSNGATAAGGHSWCHGDNISKLAGDCGGKPWVQATMAYSGTVQWQNGTTTVLARRERPQVLLQGASATGGSTGVPQFVFTSAQACVTKLDGGPAAKGCRSFTMVEEVDLS
jgi:hypothetical protein